MATKTYSYHGVRIELEPLKTHIYNDAALESYINEWGHGTRPMVQNILSEYKKFFGTKLNITEDSMVVEILAHYHCDTIIALGEAPFIRQGIAGLLARQLIEAVRKNAAVHTAVIDCGESSCDSNRAIWDKFQGLSGVLETILTD